MQHKECISQSYAVIMLALSSLVLLNMRCSILSLISFILLSLPFFYLQLDAPFLMDLKDFETVKTLVTIIAGLFLVKGFTRVRPEELVIYRDTKVNEAQKDSKKKKNK